MHLTRRSTRTRLLLALLLLPTTTLPAQQPDPYLTAQQSFAAKNYREAAHLFGLAADPTHPDALLMQARSLVELNEVTSVSAAEPVLQTYLRANPESADALYLLGYVLERQGKPRDSLAIFTRAAAIRPPQPNDLKLVALDYVLLKDYPDAAHWLDRALAADPRNTDAWYSLGRVRMEEGNFIEAERAFHRALALSPADVKALDNLGLSLEAQNRTDEALTAYTQAIAAQSQTPHKTEQPLLNLGTLLNTKARSADAIPPLQQSIAIAPRCPKCHEELARAYLATHQDPAATREMELAVALDPQNPRLHYQMGQIYRHAGLTAKADAELKTSADLYGSHSTPVDR